MPSPPSRYRWNARAGRYLDTRTGRFVSWQTIRRELDDALEATKRRMVSAGEQLRAGSISLEDWFVATRRLVKQVHLYSAAAAKGGWAQLSQADYGRVGAIVRDQYEFLLRFAEQIATQTPLDGRFLARVKLYADAGRATFHRTEREEMAVRQFTEERSMLHPADHCGGCVAEAAKDWQPIGSITPIGERECKGNCRCTMEYR